MFYLIRFVNTRKKGLKNTWYQVTREEPRTYDTHEVLVSGLLGTRKDIAAYAEGSFQTFDLAAQEIPDEFEDEGKGMFTDPRPIMDVAEWLSEETEDIKAMSSSIIDDYIREQEEDADVEGVLLRGDMRAYIQNLREKKKPAKKQP